jgi:hypothetical protein
MENKINFFDFLDIIGCNLKITRYNNQDNRWTCTIEYGEIKESKESSILSGSYGNGKSTNDAINNFLNEIKGKLLVINAMSKDRREYNIPFYLFL